MRPADALIRRRDAVLASGRGLGRLAAGELAEPVELVERRTVHSKTWDLGNGEHHLSQSVTPIHYAPAAGGSLEEIDTAWQVADDGIRMDSGPYQAQILADGVGWRHTSRRGGWVEMRLVSVDGQPVAALVPPRVDGDQVTWDQVAPGVDIRVVAFAGQSEAFKRLTGPTELEWQVTEGGPADRRPKLQETLVGWDRRGDRLEILTERQGDRFRERWTGRVSRITDPASRRKGWVVPEDAGHVVVDASITEDVAANVDDGFCTNSFNWLDNYTAWNVGRYFGTGDQSVAGVRWRTVAIPAGATVSAATLTVRVTQDYGAGSVRIYGADVDDAPLWTATFPRAIAKTTAMKQWTPTATGVQSVDILNPVAEVLGRAGWVSGNDLGLALFPNGVGAGQVVVRCEDYANAGTDSAQLDVTFTTGAAEAGTTASPWRGPTPGMRGPTAEPRAWGGVPSAVGPPTVVSVDQATETDTAQALTSAKTAALGQVTETDTAQALGAVKARQIGQPSDTSTAQPVGKTKTADVAQTTEADTAAAVSARKTATVGQASEAGSAQLVGMVKTSSAAQAVESNSAQAVASAKRTALGQPTETDAAQAITPVRTATVGQASDASLARPVESAKTAALGQATQSDTSQPITASKTATAGQAVDTSSAQPVAWAPKHRLVAQATETATAQQVTAGKTGHPNVAAETDTAQPFGTAKTATFGQVVETDQAQAITQPGELIVAVGQASDTSTAGTVGTAKTRAVGVAAESGTALAFTVARVRTLSQAVETDAAGEIGTSKTAGLGLASTTDTAGALATSKAATLAQAAEADAATALAAIVQVGRASEVDTARAVTVASVAYETPASRTYAIPAESRTFAVRAENRTTTVEAEDRTVVVR